MKKTAACQNRFILTRVSESILDVYDQIKIICQYV